MIKSLISLIIIPIFFQLVGSLFYERINFNDYIIVYLDKKYFDYINFLSFSILIYIIFLFLLITIINAFVNYKASRLINFYLPLINLTWYSLVLISISIVVIFNYIIFLIFNYLIPPFTPTGLYLILIIFLIGGSLAGLQVILSVIYNFSKSSTPLKVHGNILKSSEQPKFYSLIKDLSKKINSPMPDNIIFTSDIDFYVTSYDVNVSNYKEEKILKGNSLCVPFIMFKILTIDELTGIIGHELAHFSGKDTLRRIKVNNMHLTLEKKFNVFGIAFHDIKRSKGLDKPLASLAGFFISMILGPMIFLFNNLIKKNIQITIDHEYRADEIGASLCKNKKSFITGLCKFYVYDNLWYNTEERIFNRKTVNTKKTLTKEFFKLFDGYISNFNPKKDLKQMFDYEMKHPCDTHPPTIKRGKRLGINMKDISKNDLLKLPPNVSNILINYDSIDKELTAL